MVHEKEIKFGCLDCGSYGLHHITREFMWCDACGGIFQLIFETHKAEGRMTFRKINTI